MSYSVSTCVLYGIELESITSQVLGSYSEDGCFDRVAKESSGFCQVITSGDQSMGGKFRYFFTLKDYIVPIQSNNHAEIAESGEYALSLSLDFGMANKEKRDREILYQAGQHKLVLKNGAWAWPDLYIVTFAG